ncbi:hypothetical protein ANO11243_026780 [Dothideomycetidae sp. 11243]|nr:hypothetical protein ANO11243_026780 [fungal sp. No.11243]
MESGWTIVAGEEVGVGGRAVKAAGLRTGIAGRDHGTVWGEGEDGPGEAFPQTQSRQHPRTHASVASTIHTRVHIAHPCPSAAHTTPRRRILGRYCLSPPISWSPDLRHGSQWPEAAAARQKVVKLSTKSPRALTFVTTPRHHHPLLPPPLPKKDQKEQPSILRIRIRTQDAGARTETLGAEAEGVLGRTITDITRHPAAILGPHPSRIRGSRAPDIRAQHLLSPRSVLIARFCHLLWATSCPMLLSRCNVFGATAPIVN